VSLAHQKRRSKMRKDAGPAAWPPSCCLLFVELDDGLIMLIDCEKLGNSRIKRNRG
jgi:hypothetical protein